PGLAVGETAHRVGDLHRRSVAHGDAAGHAAEILGALANLGEVALSQLRHLTAVANLAGEQNVAVAVAQLDQPVHQLDPLFDVDVSPGGAAVPLKGVLRRFDGPRDFRFAHFADGGQHFLRARVDRLERGVHRPGNLFAIDDSAQRLAAVAAELGEFFRRAEG